MRLNAKWIYLPILSVTLLISGCGVPAYSELNTPYVGYRENQMNDDHALALKLQDKIKSTYGKNAATLVVVDHYNVLLLGEVESQTTKEQIGAMITAIPVVQTFWDYTTIATIPKLKDDASLTKKAQLRIKSENNIAIEEINATVVDGVAYITGNIKIDQIRNLNQAIAGIYSLDGINKVINLTKETKYGSNSDNAYN